MTRSGARERPRQHAGTPAQRLNCRRKVRYPSFYRAVVEADRIRGETNRVLGVYACPVCGDYHHTSAR